MEDDRNIDVIGAVAVMSLHCIIKTRYFYTYFHFTASYCVFTSLFYQPNYSLIALGAYINVLYSNVVVFAFALILSLNPLARNAVTIFRLFDFFDYTFTEMNTFHGSRIKTPKKIQTLIVYLPSVDTRRIHIPRVKKISKNKHATP